MGAFNPFRQARSWEKEFGKGGKEIARPFEKVKRANSARLGTGIKARPPEDRAGRQERRPEHLRHGR